MNIYVLTAKGDAMKIGLAEDVKARVAELQIGNHRKLRVSAVYHDLSDEQAKFAERRCHEILKERQLHIRGEWFRLDVREAKKVLNRITGGNHLNRVQYESNDARC